jgi:GNAT superfamily N-acetyltransferase
MAEEITVASEDADYDAFGDLIREYWGWLQARYLDVSAFIDNVAGHQALDAELADVRKTYGPPAGKLLLARRDGEVSGGVAYRDFHDGSCEMKRMFVPERFQGQGTGRALCRALIDEATADGYRLMRLDTGFRNTGAMVMYESLGFRECPAYRDYPDRLLPHLRFMEKPLVS